MTQNTNRIEFYVPVENMAEFVTILTTAEIDNEIIGITDENEIIIYAEYVNDQDEAIARLTDLVDYYDYEEGSENDEMNLN